ncbi:hypothetical protein AB0O51_16885 [Streptomyces sp. NPDC090301]|uniref:hypothetical protein n=1 Tax=Streptomyces sp. NPDC090301 TaxID=3154975 RepID=UPI00344316DA
MNHDRAQAFVRQAMQRVVADALAERSGTEPTEDDHPALDTWGGCAARLVAEAGESAEGRSG